MIDFGRARSWARMKFASVSLLTPRVLIADAFKKASEVGYMINQSPGEAAAAAGEVWITRARTVLEIGVEHGGWLYAMRPFCMSALKYVAVDPTFSPGWAVYRKLLTDTGVDVSEVRATSQAAFEPVNRALESRRVDVLHIDGDHAVESVLFDWRTYSPLVRPGGLVLMHDVCGNRGPAEALNAILAGSDAGRFAYTHVFCDMWNMAAEHRMGVAMIRMRN
ncbi:MAG: class I SAM-dependent methyltransferase [Candidatus Brocadiia bacterium]